MPNGEEEQQATQDTINLMSPEMSEPVNLSLTVGEAMLVRNVLENSINPRGFQMVEFCYHLMTKFKEAIETKTDSSDAPEVFVSEDNE